MHRPSNVDDETNLKALIDVLGEIARRYNTQIVFPIHPRTAKQIDLFKIKIPKNIKTIKPVGFLEMLQLESAAKLILTDSGGIQEESCILKTPCVTLRENTERPEVVEAGASVLAGRDPGRIIKSVETMLGRSTNWENPLGDGKTAEHICKVVEG